MVSVFDVSAEDGPVALALSLTRPARLAQIAWSEDRMDKLTITAPRDWASALDLKGAGHGDALATFFAGHGNNHLWRLDDDSIRLAQLAAEPPAWVPREALPLYRRARAFDLICLTLSTLALRREKNTLPRPAQVPARERIRIFPARPSQRTADHRCGRPRQWVRRSASYNAASRNYTA